MELAENNPRLFGNFSTQTRESTRFISNISQVYLTGSNVKDYSSALFAVSEKYAWEQELVRFKLPLTDQGKYEAKLW